MTYQGMKTSKKEKLALKQHQLKSRWYYIFWGTATVAVVAGQVYVGSGYRQMSRSFNRIVDSIVLEVYKFKSDPGIEYLDNDYL